MTDTRDTPEAADEFERGKEFAILHARLVHGCDHGLPDHPTTRDTPEAVEVRPVTRLVSLRIVVDPPRDSYWWRTEEQRIRGLEAWAHELEEFVRDHRSQDPISLTVERENETVCDRCHREWETYTEDGATCCAGCGARVEAP